MTLGTKYRTTASSARQAVSHCRHDAQALGRLVLQYPSLACVPLFVLAVLLAGGITAVIHVKNSDVSVAKERAAVLARDAASWYQQQIEHAIAPVEVTAAVVKFQPEFYVVESWFGLLAEAMIKTSQAAPGAIQAVQLVPNGVIRLVYPDDGIYKSALGMDLFNSSVASIESARAVMRRGTLQVLGPIRQPNGFYGLVVSLPIWVQGVEPNTTFGLTGPVFTNCGAPCAYNATTRSKPWGLAQAIVDLQSISNALEANKLRAMGYRYEVEALSAQLVNATSQTRIVVRSSELPVDPVEAFIDLPDAQWVVRVAPESGWEPAWYGGLLAAVVVLSVIISLLLFAAMVSWRRHQLLLEALLPKEVIREMKVDDAASLGALIQQTDTPADLLLKMMGELLQGRTPELRDVVFIRTALLRNADVYQPLNLRGQLKEANFDSDVVQALIRQLGDTGGIDGQSVCSEPLTGDPGANSRQLASLAVSGCGGADDLVPTSRSMTPLAGGGAGSSTPQLNMETLTGALSLLLTPQLPLAPQPPAPAPPPVMCPVSVNAAALAVSGNLQAQLVSATVPTGALAPGNALNLPPVPMPTEPFLLELPDASAAAGDWTEHATPSAARPTLLSHASTNGGTSTPTGAERSAVGSGGGGGGPVGLMSRLASAIPLMGGSSARDRDRERERERDRDRDGGSTASGSGQVAGGGNNINTASMHTPRSRLEALGLPAPRTGSMDGGPQPALDGRGLGGALGTGGAGLGGGGSVHSGNSGRLSVVGLAGATAAGAGVSLRQASNLGFGAGGAGGLRSGAQLQLPSSKGISLAALAAPSGAGAGLTSVTGMVPPPGPPPPVIEEVERLLADADSWTFDTWRLAEATQGHALSAMAFYLMHREGLITKFKIKPAILARLLRALEAGYQGNPYHNATHAADVLQTLHVIIHGAQLHVHYLDKLGLLAAYFAAIVHDHNHPGLTNDFLVATHDMLAIRYNDKSPLENHHAASCFGLMALQPELDALAPLSKTDRGTFRKQVIEMVMGTDMKQHFAILAHFNTVHRLASYSVQSAKPRASGGLERAARTVSTSAASTVNAPRPIDETERLLTLQVALKVADIGHLGEEIEVHCRWLGVLEEEFFNQGDRERALGLPISPLFDRTKQGVSKSQVGFYDFVGLPLIHAVSSAFAGARPLMSCFLANYDHWKAVEGQQQAAAKPAELKSQPPKAGAATSPKPQPVARSSEASSGSQDCKNPRVRQHDDQQPQPSLVVAMGSNDGAFDI
ncbi:hypothetical protein HXX76_006216 [Chlamydomonas incerta]|uniref:Phosphodiesterase n=1 Tax=Chlamydomonas incerta TaxID=51695 RepID=A0A835T0Q3_CHLIN|nr:hypothetical protein HXX76_006216 [Chlamydomonas incerta]|eukprot:KAG2436688.1 hypothetical protein HXX76_006216 [Chlamydomonas incerta]